MPPTTGRRTKRTGRKRADGTTVREGDEDEDQDDESDDEYMTKTEKLAKIHVCCLGGGGGSESLAANFKLGSAPGRMV